MIIVYKQKYLNVWLMSGPVQKFYQYKYSSLVVGIRVHSKLFVVSLWLGARVNDIIV